MCKRCAGVCQFIHFTLRQMDAMSVNAAGAEQIVLRIDIEIIAVPGIETGDSSQFILVFCQMRLQMQVRPAAQQICRQRQLPWARRRGESRRDAVTQPLPAVPALDQIQAVTLAMAHVVAQCGMGAAIHHHLATQHAQLAGSGSAHEGIYGMCVHRGEDRGGGGAVGEQPVEKKISPLRCDGRIGKCRFRGVDGMLQPVEQCFARRG